MATSTSEPLQISMLVQGMRSWTTPPPVPALLMIAELRDADSIKSWSRLPASHSPSNTTSRQTRANCKRSNSLADPSLKSASSPCRNYLLRLVMESSHTETIHAVRSLITSTTSATRPSTVHSAHIGQPHSSWMRLHWASLSCHSLAF